MSKPAFIYPYSVRTIAYHTEEISLSTKKTARNFTDPTHPIMEEMETVRATCTESPQFWNELQGGEMKVLAKHISTASERHTKPATKNIIGKPQTEFK